MKRLTHILVLLLIAFGVGMGHATCTAATVPCGQRAGAEQCEAQRNGRQAGVLINCDQLVAGEKALPAAFGSGAMRVCNQQPARWLSVRGALGRTVTAVAMRYGIRDSHHAVTVSPGMCHHSASVSFPLCGNASQRVVALRHIVR